MPNLLTRRVLQEDFVKRLREARNFEYPVNDATICFPLDITTVAVMVAPVFISGLRSETAGALIGAARFVGILNAFVRPVLLILSGTESGGR